MRCYPIQTCLATSNFGTNFDKLCNTIFDTKITVSATLILLKVMFSSLYSRVTLNCYELAGMGYRAALEVLIKDYALNVLHDNKQYIEQLNLNNAIEHYFKGKDYEINNITANIVRINGNNFVHWDKPEDFNSKKALDTFKRIL